MASRDVGLVINSLSGGLNNEAHESAIADDECTVANNVEFFGAECGERRSGCDQIDLTGCGAAGEDIVIHLTTHLEAGVDIKNSEVWAVGITEDASVTVSQRAVDGTWTDRTFSDAPDTTFPDGLKWDSQSLHGKLFFCYKSNQDRTHVWDGTSVRRTGLAGPTAAPTATDSGSGAFTGDRIYRVRAIKKSGSEIILRSEPGDELTFTPSGTGSGVTVTRPSLGSEGATHWELEASDPDEGNFYVIAEVIAATTTYTDTTLVASDYALDFELAPDIGDYNLIPSFKFVVADQDRPIFACGLEDEEHGSRIAWTPVWNDPGVGNDERIPQDTDNFIDLDWMAGGDITGISEPLNGSFYAFKHHRIYKLQRTGDVNQAYESYLLSTAHGAIEGSIVSGVDEYGRGCVYFLDPQSGPMRISASGIQYMHGVKGTWRHINNDATDVIAHGVYYLDKQQQHWWIATDEADSPNLKVINQVSEIRSSVENGTTRGWATADGKIARAYCSVIVPEIVLDATSGQEILAYLPYIGVSSEDGSILRCDTGTDDFGERYRAVIRSKPFILAGLLNNWGGMNAALLAEPNDDRDITIQVKLIRDFGLEENDVNCDFLPTQNESTVIRRFDNLNMSEAVAIQVEFSDPEYGD